MNEIDNLDIFNSIDETIALIENLDLVITSPNLTIHLSGSIGKKCIALYPKFYQSIFLNQKK